MRELSVTLRKVVTCIAGLVVGLIVTMAGAAAQQVKPDYPRISIPYPSPNIPEFYGPTGSAALQILGPYMPSVAAWYGLKPEDISSEFLRNSPLLEWRLDNDGRIVVAERFGRYSFDGNYYYYGPPPNLPGLFPLETTFTLHSNPAAKRKIWLAFNGPEPSPGSPQPGPTTSDKINIQHIWQRLAEDFVPFDVDVTTERLSDEDVRRSGPDDERYAFLVTIDRSQDLPTSGAIEDYVYLNSFDDLNDRRRRITVKWPYEYRIPQITPDMIAHRIAHMLGHALGLRDEAVASAYSTYTYPGHRTSTGTWAPIMGTPGDAVLTQFTRGELEGAVNKSDSIAWIGRTLPPRPDDAGDTPQTAVLLSYYRDSTPLGNYDDKTMFATASGIIGHQGDKDLYAITAADKFISATVAAPFDRRKYPPGGASTNVDLVLTLLDGSGNVVASSNPEFYLDAQIYYQVPRPGRYYLQVSSTGVSRPSNWGSNFGGYSDYGSLGYYTLSTNFSLYTGTPPVASLSVSPTSGVAPMLVKFDASASRDDRQIKFIYWDFGDGTRDETGSLRMTSKTYRKPGTYRVGILVVDDEGLSSSDWKTVTVKAQRELTAQIDLRLLKVSATSSAAVGSVLVLDDFNMPVPNATVRYSWSGLTQGDRSLTSQAQGAPVLSLASNQTGCFRLTVTGITLAGYAYNVNSPAQAEVCRRDSNTPTQ